MARWAKAAQLSRRTETRIPERSSVFEDAPFLSMPLERPERHSIRRPHRYARHASDDPGRHAPSRPRDRRKRAAHGLDGRVPCAREPASLFRCSAAPRTRTPIREPIGCGIRAIDGFLTCGRGQRVGIFGGSGVGKSTLIGMMARGTSADLTVLALVGERGREVREFLEDALGEEGQTPLRRRRFHLGPVSAAAYARRATATSDRGILLPPGQARAAGGGFAHALRHGAA